MEYEMKEANNSLIIVETYVIASHGGYMDKIGIDGIFLDKADENGISETKRL